MIGLLGFAITFCIILLSVEIPVYIQRREEEDLLIVIFAGLMMAACLIVLWWR